jgi:hypothetical protein
MRKEKILELIQLLDLGCKELITMALVGYFICQDHYVVNATTRICLGEGIQLQSQPCSPAQRINILLVWGKKANWLQRWYRR